MVLPDLTLNFEALHEHWLRLQRIPMRDLFGSDDARFDNMSIRLDDIVIDFSKNRLDDPALAELLKLADAAGLEAKRNAMLNGEKINTTENRAVLHTALRQQSDEPVLLDGADVMPVVRQVLNQMERFSEQVRTGEYQPSGKPITHVVNIGIGGSDLGPKMVANALLPFADGPETLFVSNVDGADIADTLKALDPKSTLFIVASKTFTTQETMINAETAMGWMKGNVGRSAADHFCANSTNLEATRAFGIPDERAFGFWDWVGGRYSVWSAIGLSVMMAIGPAKFGEFLAGAASADDHFASAPIANNIPVIMALLGIWHRNVCKYSAHAVLPYDNRLEYLPAWLQQLDMESNGKSVNADGEPVKLATGPFIFGETGTNGQHAFYQLLHQGTDIVPCDFLVAANGIDGSLDHHHRILLANCLAQSEALMMGRSLEEAGGDPHRAFDGNRPSNTLLYRNLDPRTLGTLMALYEHKVFVQGVIWGINSFDQWGVELGKELAGAILPKLEARSSSDASNASTAGLLQSAVDFRKS